MQQEREREEATLSKIKIRNCCTSLLNNLEDRNPFVSISNSPSRYHSPRKYRESDSLDNVCEELEALVESTLEQTNMARLQSRSVIEREKGYDERYRVNRHSESAIILANCLDECLRILTLTADENKLQAMHRAKNLARSSAPEPAEAQTLSNALLLVLKSNTAQAKQVQQRPYSASNSKFYESPLRKHISWQDTKQKASTSTSYTTHHSSTPYRRNFGYGTDTWTKRQYHF